jgi:GNAT superfamily N-acetyltransferase
MTSSPIEFRYEARPDDLALVRSLVESTDVFSPVEVDVAVELVEDRLKRGEQSDYRFVFAELEGRTVGYTCFGPICLTAASYDLYWIAVEKACQGRKIGQLLMAESERLIRKAGGRNVYIETSSRPPYSPTRAFYLRCGYIEEAVLKNFYAPGDDKVMYSRDISD